MSATTLSRVNSDTASARVLIAEDEALLAEDLRELVENLGHTVVGVVDSGDAAFAAAGSASPDLILMDIRLRGATDGIDAAARIEERYHTPLVYLTAHSDEATVRRARRTNPLGYLIKPLRERDLRVTVEMALHRSAIERRLRESEARYATTLNSIGDAVVATDADGRVTFMNPVAETLTKWPLSEAIGRPLEQILALRDAVTGLPRACPVRRALAEGRIVHLPDRTLLVTRDGREVSVGDSAAPIRDALDVHGAVVVFRDLTAEQRNAERARTLEEEHRQTQKLEAVGRLASGLAHDVNNLMAVVIGFSELALEQTPGGSSLREMVEEIKRAGDRTAALNRQLLSFVRNEANAPTVLDLNAVVCGAEAMLRRLIGPDVVLRAHLQPGLCAVLADARQLEQVLMNLAVNARDAMPAGGTLTIETENVSLSAGVPGLAELRAGNYVRLSVSDSGYGMDAITRSRVFDPFFTTKGPDRGTGLGLATVFRVVKEARGHVTVDSELGSGTTFTVYLPQTESRVERDQEVTHTKPRGGAETVLLVDDDDAVRRMTREILRIAGYRVLEAANGEEALLLCETERGTIDLLLTDAIMPVLSGRAVAERVRTRRPSIRVMFMSGYSEDHVRSRDPQAKMGTFLSKPFSACNLLATVRQSLDATP